MNAYELSEKLHKAVNNDEKHLTLDIEAMLMLRQQADRIAELEKELGDANTLLVFNKLSNLTNTTPQIKELSDEEIDDIWAGISTGDDCVDMHLFAKAILKKASEK